MGIKIKSLSINDRPREKLLEQGRSSLTDSELLAIILGSGNKEQNAVELAQSILNGSDNSLAKLAKKEIYDLTTFKGIGEAKAINVIASLELGKRRKSTLKDIKKNITSSKSAFEELYHIFTDLPYEEFWVILLNQANQIIKTTQISQGGIAGTIADPKKIFKIALQNNTSGIILSHNHPSGNTTPSEADKKLTSKIKNAGKHLDINILDHLIIGDNRYFSFADQGLM